MCIGFAFDQAHYTVSESAESIRVCANLNVPFLVSEQLILETDLKLFAVNETRELVAAPIALGEGLAFWYVKVMTSLHT